MNRIAEFIKNNPDHPLVLELKQIQKDDQTSALFWLPKISKAGLPIPRTMIVPYEHKRFVEMMEGGRKYNTKQLFKDVERACIKIGYPCFFRTDLASAKHDGEKAYLIKSKDDIQRIVYSTVEDNELKFFAGSPWPQAFMVRQFLELDSRFKAFGGLPIAREWRFFANSNKVICYHPYWPEKAITFGHHSHWPDEAKSSNDVKKPSNWKSLLKDLHKEIDIVKLKVMAVKAAKVCDGTFSIDFAMDKNRKWWLIDMATAKSSWHWPDCKFVKKENTNE